MWWEKYTYNAGDNVLTKTTPFIEDFDDGNHTGWSASGSWSAANGYMRNSVSGSWQAFWKTDTEADYEIRYSYYNENTSASGSHGFLHARWLSAGPRLVINMLPDRIVLREYNGSSWTYHATAWVTTEEATWYDVYAKLNGSNVEVWWGEKGGALSKIIDTSSVSLTTTERFRFEVAPSAQFRFDDIAIFSDGVKSTTTFTHNNGNEQTAMTVDGTTTNFAYEAWGRMTSRTRGSLAAQYAWRYGSLLAGVTSNFPGEAATVNYVYDGLQNRRLKQVNGTNYTWTRYDAKGRALADYSGGAGYWDIGGRQRSFHGGAEIEGSSPQTGTPSYYLRNHLGSVMATTNASKNIVASYQYTPYGEFLSESTTGDHATFGYTGHRLDRELNHYYAKFRYYNPSTMRWLSRDPLGMVDGPNVYAYVRGNVVRNIDSLGLYKGPPGKLCIDKKCDKSKLENYFYLPESLDHKNKPTQDDLLPVSQIEGDCVNVDGAYGPQGRIKIRNIGKCTIKCDNNGVPSQLHCRPPYTECDDKYFPKNPNKGKDDFPPSASRWIPGRFLW